LLHPPFSFPGINALEYKEVKEESRMLQHENKMMKFQVDDLSSQLQTLLRECQSLTYYGVKSIEPPPDRRDPRTGHDAVTMNLVSFKYA
jgi:hypothetical protein